MIALDIILDGEGAFKDVPDGMFVESKETMKFAALECGMQSGAPSIAIAIPFPDGSMVMGQTSLKCFLSAADAFKAKFGDPR